MDKKFLVRFIGFWVVNSLILALANTFFPGSSQLGNAFLNTPAAAIFSGFLLTVLLLLAKGLAKSANLTKNGRGIMFLYYAGAASFATWLVARVAVVSGFGIVKFTWAFVIGVTISVANWLLRQAYKGMKLS